MSDACPTCGHVAATVTVTKNEGTPEEVKLEFGMFADGRKMRPGIRFQYSKAEAKPEGAGEVFFVTPAKRDEIALALGIELKKLG